MALERIQKGQSAIGVVQSGSGDDPRGRICDNGDRGASLYLCIDIYIYIFCISHSGAKVPIEQDELHAV